jgi:hypothetical protein
MADVYDIEIYHYGVCFKAPIRDRERYLREKAFLGELTGLRPTADMPTRPIPDPTTDFYVLNDEQLAAYSAFRKTISKVGDQG